jgi:hypothetical protein
MNLVTAKMDRGIRAAATRKNKFETTIVGAASHTKRNTGGMFFSAFNRSLQLGSDACFIAELAAAIAGLSQVENIQVSSPGCFESTFVSALQTAQPCLDQRDTHYTCISLAKIKRG